MSRFRLVSEMHGEGLAFDSVQLTKFSGLFWVPQSLHIKGTQFFDKNLFRDRVS